MTTHTQLIKQKQIDDQVNTIGKWINDVNGHNSDEALEFIFKYRIFPMNLDTNLSPSILDKIFVQT